MAACATEFDYELLRDHVVLANEDGKMIDLETKSPLALRAARIGIDRILKKAEEVCAAHHERAPDSAPYPLLVHVHGGMNNYDASLERAQNVIGRMQREAGADWHYPIFLVWPSAPLDCYHEHVWHLRFGHHEWWGPPTSPFVFVADLASGAARSVYSLPRQIIMDGCNAAEIVTGRPQTPESRGAEAIYDAVLADKSLTGVHVGKGQFSRGFWRQAGRALTWTLLQPIKLVTSALLCDGLGNGAWKVMLRRTYNLYRPATSLDAAQIGDHPEDLATILHERPAGAAALLFQQLEEHFAGCGGTRITLVGHSMGAIVLNIALSILTDHHVSRERPRVLDTVMRGEPLRIDDVVYMAPACSIAEAEQMLVPYLEHSPRTRFHLLTLHPFAEFSERPYLDIVPRGSLLAWIEYWYATAGGHSERRLGIWDSAIQALPIFSGVAAQVEIKAFGVQGASLPQAHGDFNDCPFWRHDFWSASVRDVYSADWWQRRP